MILDHVLIFSKLLSTKSFGNKYAYFAKYKALLYRKNTFECVVEVSVIESFNPIMNSTLKGPNPVTSFNSTNSTVTNYTSDSTVDDDCIIVCQQLSQIEDDDRFEIAWDNAIINGVKHKDLVRGMEELHGIQNKKT